MSTPWLASTRVQGGEEETKERKRGDETGENKSDHLTGIDIYMVGRYMDHVKLRSVCSSGHGTNVHGEALCCRGILLSQQSCLIGGCYLN
jgi:hypothetical protein